MERQSSTFEYLCRVCAANTKGKNSVAECVYIFKTAGLKDNIEKYLYLTVSEDDILPKVLCKACFRQVMATASLSKIAKHTQKVFRDFIFNTKACLQADSSDSSTPTVTTNSSAAAAPATTPPSTTTTATYTAASLQPPAEKPKAREKRKEKSQVISDLTIVPAPPPPPPQPPTSTSQCTHKDEVIVNVSVNDPLTRETQHKMITASRHRQNSIDTRFTPRSIAQRGFVGAPKQSQPQPSAAECTTATAIAAKKQARAMAASIINYFPNQPQQVTAITSGGYVIGNVSSSTPANNPAEPAAAPAANSLQQKRRNLKTALNNIKASANATGQISLLKNSQKTATVQQQQQQQQQPPKTVVVEPPILLVEDDIPAEPLPEKMIIAATKQQKHQGLGAAAAAAAAPSLSLPTPPPPPPPPSQQPTPPNISSDLTMDFEPQTEPTDLSQSNRTSLPDDILLGKVIKDGDLLKLILKALKWPVNKHNMEDELNRLRNSRFANIMADPNLLKDADLTQIMGPYLGPVLHAAQMLQQQQIAASAAAASTVVTKKVTPAELQVAGITTALPYKLPAETSVQLVPASPEATEEESTGDITGGTKTKSSASSQSLKRSAGGKAQEAKSKAETAAAAPPPTKRTRKSPRGRSASIFNTSEEYAALNSTFTSQYLNSKSTPDFHVDLDPSALFTQFGMLSGLSASSSNEALLALLQRQRVALSRLHQQQQQEQSQSKPKSRRQRSRSIITVPATGSDFIFDTDDIILMEPDDCTTTPTTTSTGGESTATNSQNTMPPNASSDDVVGSSSSTLSQHSDVHLNPSANMNTTPNIFQIPQPVVDKPIITRPIIKRRKTVIQASPACMNLAINSSELTSISSRQAAGGDNIVNTTAATTKLASSSVTNIFASSMAAAAAAAVAAANASVPQQKLSKTQSLDSLNVIATQYPSNIISIGTQVPSNTTNRTNASEAATPIINISSKATETALTLTATAATSVSSLLKANNTTTNVTGVSSAGAITSTTEKPTTATTATATTTTRSSGAAKRQSATNKSALGQQLLEAIGLQKVASETKDVAAIAPAPAASIPAPGARGSVQQIRSALKKSLQKAQEQQQQQRNKKSTPRTIDEENGDSHSNKNVNIVREVVVQPRSKSTTMPVGDLDVEEEINKITLVLQSKSKDDKKIEEADRRLTAAAPTKIPGIRRKVVPATRNRKSAIVLVADEIVDLIDDEDNPDGAAAAAEGKRGLMDNAEQKEKTKEKEVSSAATEKTDNNARNARTATPVRYRGRKLKPEEVEQVVAEEDEDDDDDDEDNKPLKPRTVKPAQEKPEDEPRQRATTPRQRGRPTATTPTSANGRKAPSERDYEKESDDGASVKNDNESTTSTITRPSRISKTMSKYYKGPDKSPSTPRRSTMSTRSSRVRS